MDCSGIHFFRLACDQEDEGKKTPDSEVDAENAQEKCGDHCVLKRITSVVRYNESIVKIA